MAKTRGKSSKKANKCQLGKNQGVQKKTSGKSKIGVPARKASKTIYCHGNIHKHTQTDISMTLLIENASEDDYLLALHTLAEISAHKCKPRNSDVIVKHDKKQQSESIQSMPSTSEAESISFPLQRSVGTLTDQLITVHRAVEATKAVKVPKRHAAVMTEKIVTHDRKVSAKLPLTSPKRNAAVMTEAVVSAAGKAASAETDDEITPTSDASDTEVPKKIDVGVMTENYAKFCLYADETLDEKTDEESDEESYAVDLTKN